jgi:hypothetical protein
MEVNMASETAGSEEIHNTLQSELLVSVIRLMESTKYNFGLYNFCLVKQLLVTLSIYYCTSLISVDRIMIIRLNIKEV